MDLTGKRRVRLVAALMAALIVPMWSAPRARAAVITRADALRRPDVVVVSGRRTHRWRACPVAERTYDLRRLRSFGSFDDLANLSVGNDCAAQGVVTVGGLALGSMSHSLTWEQVKARYDAAGLRFEGTSWLASFGASLENVEDGFAPRVTEGTEGDNADTFLLSGTYMDWIRDDAIEDDDLMSGVVKNLLIDGTNRFLSARPPSSGGYENPGMSVRIDDVVVHLKAMPIEGAHDGRGFGGIFKWSDAAGTVEMSNAVFLLDEPPIGSPSFPPGTYTHVTLVLDYRGGYPGELPNGVKTTHELGVWKHARRHWIRAHSNTIDAARAARNRIAAR